MVTGSVNTSLPGSYALTYTVSDGTNTTSVTRTVNVVDTTPPSISGVSASPNSLWPPNHFLRDVAVNYAVSDAGDGAPSCSLHVTSDEPIICLGGLFFPDWLVPNAHQVRLRAERCIFGDGRVYTLTVKCLDDAGNTSTAATTVAVPKHP